MWLEDRGNRDGLGQNREQSNAGGGGGGLGLACASGTKADNKEVGKRQEVGSGGM